MRRASMDFITPSSLGLAALLVLCSACSGPAEENEATNLPIEPTCTSELRLGDDVFDGREAAFVWLDPGSRQMFCYGPTDMRRIPASTFKIPHALIALDSGVLEGPEARMAYDPVKYPREDWWSPVWAQDHTLASALEHSVVWYYREVAEMVGPEREQAYLESLGLGNAEVGDNPTSFWLVGPLKISAEEQVIFLERLWEGTLPVSEEAQRLTRDMVNVLAEFEGERTLGKTGTGRMAEGSLNWLIGAVERPERPAFFAFWIEAEGWMPPGQRLAILDAVRREMESVGSIP